jgi:alcohol dehydrogenase
MLPHVVRWNAPYVGAGYGDLLRMSDHGGGGDAGERLAARLRELARAGGLPSTLRELGVEHERLPALSAEAATQWTGAFNPRPFDHVGALALYEDAY